MNWFTKAARVPLTGLLVLALLAATASAAKAPATTLDKIFDDPVTIDSGVDRPVSVAAADFDNDDDVDVALAGRDEKTIALYKNDGSQKFTRKVIDSEANKPTSVIAVDIDKDGKMDLAAGFGAGSSIAWYKNEGKDKFTKNSISIKSEIVRDVIAADFDDDGDMDLAAAMADDDKISWFENDGKGTFTEHGLSANLEASHFLDAVDLDDNGDIDLVSANMGSANVDGPSITWYENQGSQGFKRHTASNKNIPWPGGVAAGDFDGDDDVDLAVVNTLLGGTAVLWLQNDGSEVFTNKAIDKSLYGMDSISAVDLDGDGDLDLAAASDSKNLIVGYENSGDGIFTKRVLATGVFGARSVAPADLDRDGDLDLLYVEYSDQKFGWVENISTSTQEGRPGGGDPEPHDFTDVPTTGWKDEAVRWMKASGVTTGCGPTTFCPDVPMTREQQVTFLWRYIGQPDPGPANPFTDVDRDRYFTEPIDWAYNEGITTGYAGQNRFATGDNVIRGQAVTMLWRQAGEPKPEKAAGFTDVAAGRYFTDAVAWAYEVGVTKGTSKTSFSPDDPVTRVQFAAFLSRYDKLPKK